MISKGLIFYIAVGWYAIFAAILSMTLNLIGDYFKNKGNQGVHKITRVFIFIVILPVIFYCFVWFDSVYIEPNWIQVRKVSIKANNFNPGLKKLKIIQISDLHIEKVGFKEKSLIKIINKIKPDIIFITGDFINSSSGLLPCKDVLKQLKANKGIYAILGNHDYYYLREQDIIRTLKDIGIVVLRHENLKIDFGEKGSFWLVGLSDRYGAIARYGDDSYVSYSFKGVPLAEPKILLIHNPEVVKVKSIFQYKPELILAGHTHGGQFGIPFLRKYSWYAERSDYMAGLFYVNNIPLYVNRGIGMITRNIRFFCRPEVTIIRLSRNNTYTYFA